jgi:hypothetical protein
LCDETTENADQQPDTGDETTTTIQSTKPEIGEETGTRSNNPGGKEQPPPREVVIDLNIDRQTQSANDIPMYGPDEIVQVHHVNTTGTGGNTYTRHTDPFKPERIA